MSSVYGSAPSDPDPPGPRLHHHDTAPFVPTGMGYGPLGMPEWLRDAWLAAMESTLACHHGGVFLYSPAQGLLFASHGFWVCALAPPVDRRGVIGTRQHARVSCPDALATMIAGAHGRSRDALAKGLRHLCCGRTTHFSCAIDLGDARVTLTNGGAVALGNAVVEIGPGPAVCDTCRGRQTLAQQATSSISLAGVGDCHVTPAKAPACAACGILGVVRLTTTFERPLSCCDPSAAAPLATPNIGAGAQAQVVPPLTSNIRSLPTVRSRDRVASVADVVSGPSPPSRVLHTPDGSESLKHNGSHEKRRGDRTNGRSNGNGAAHARVPPSPEGATDLPDARSALTQPARTEPRAAGPENDARSSRSTRSSRSHAQPPYPFCECGVVDVEAVAGMGRWEVNLVTGVLTWSAGMFALFGRRMSMGPPSTFEEMAAFLDNADARKVTVLAQTALNYGTGHMCDVRIPLTCGRERIVSIRGFVSRHAVTGSAVRWHGYVQEVTSLRSLRDTVVHLKKLLRHAREMADVGTWIYCPENERILWTKEVYGMHGIDIDEASERALEQVLEECDGNAAAPVSEPLPPTTPASLDAYLSYVHPDDLPSFMREIYTPLRKGTPARFEHTYRVRFPDNAATAAGGNPVLAQRVLYVRGECVRKDGKFVATGFVQDVTVQWDMQRARNDVALNDKVRTSVACLEGLLDLLRGSQLNTQQCEDLDLLAAALRDLIGHVMY